MEHQSRLDAEWSSNGGRGRLTARQFQPVFERLVTELELNGLGKSERELFLGYLRRVGSPWRAEILKWRGPSLLQTDAVRKFGDHKPGAKLTRSSSNWSSCPRSPKPSCFGGSSHSSTGVCFFWTILFGCSF